MVFKTKTGKIMSINDVGKLYPWEIRDLGVKRLSQNSA